MGITYGKLLLCHGILDKNRDKTISTREYKYSTVYYCFNKTFPVFGVSTTLNFPPISIDDSKRTKNPGITLMRFHLPFLLILETLLVCWQTLLTTQIFLSWSMMILIVNIPSCVSTLAVARWHEDTTPGSIMEKYATKNWGSIAMCVILKIGFITATYLS